MARIFDNNLQLPKAIILQRLNSLAEVVIYSTVTIDDQGNIVGTHHYVAIDSELSDAAIANILVTAITPQEQTDYNSYLSARTDFNGLPNWATWTGAEAETSITNSILNGWNQTQVNTYIDANTVNTVLKQIGTNLITIRGILVNMAKAIIFIRNLIIKFKG